MEHKRETGGVFWPLFLMAILFGCGSQPRSEYPVLAQTVDSDTNLGCTGLEDELLKANALRDAIFEEHGDVIREATLREATFGSALILAGDPVFGILSGMLGAATISKQTKPYIEAAAAAALRMEQLLVYKERDDCPSGPTGCRAHSP